MPMYTTGMSRKETPTKGNTMTHKATKNRFEDGTFIPCSYTYRGYTIERMPLLTDAWIPTGDFNITCPDGEWCDAYPELSYCKHMVDKWIEREEN
mgnify:CR=1 FL=1